MSVRNNSSSGSTKRADWIVPATASTNSSALTANSAKAAITTDPDTDATAGRFVFEDTSAVDSILVGLAFVMTDAANETASANVWTWQRTEDGTYIPRLLCVLAITAGARTGVAGGEITASEYFADTITVSTDNTDRGVVVEGGADGFTMAIIDHLGGEAIEVEVTTSGGTAASVKPILRGM